jgi:hypothetical protein
MGKAGFTLLQLTLTLIIIGLVVGSIMVGQNLINAAAQSAQVTQIQKYQAAVTLFQTKYNGYLPGDIPASQVTQLGFTAAPTRAGTAGLGDGNGLIEGWSFGGNFSRGYYQDGEPLFFWEDISANSGLIGETISFYPNPWNGETWTPTCIGPACLALYYPPAKIGNNFVMVYSSNGINYFTITEATLLQSDGNIQGAVGLTIQQAYNIDKKIDDGLPQSGQVQAQYLEFGVAWAGGGGVQGAAPGTAASGSSTTCYDNGGNASASMTYSLNQNNGTGINCGLSFQFNTQ